MYRGPTEGKMFQKFQLFYWAGMEQNIKIIFLFSVSIYRHSRSSYLEENSIIFSVSCYWSLIVIEHLIQIPKQRYLCSD